jgi:flagellar hook-associated protein 2
MTTVSSTSSSSTTVTTASSYASTDVTSVDWDGLIEELYNAKLAKADTYETKITTNEAKISAYEEAASLLTDLQDASDALRAATDSSGSDSDVFLTRTAYLTGVGGVTASDVVSVTADSGADTGTYSLTVQQLATAQKVASTSQTSSTTDLSLSGSFSIGIDGGTSVDIDVTEDMSLAELASAINEQTSTTGVKATVLKVSSTSYELVLSTSDTGETITVTDTDGVLQSLGVIDEDGAFADEIQASQQAIFTLDGVTVTRSSNTVDDLVDGLTFYLYSTTGDGESVSVEIEQDLSSVKDAVVAFVDAYNAYRDWALTQQETSTGGGASSDAVLFGDSTIRGINQQIASALSFSFDEASLSALGLSYDENNNLEYDEDTLNEVLLSDPELVQTFFSYTFESSSTDLGILYRGSNAPSSFTLDITVDEDGLVTGVTADGVSGLFTISSTGHGITGVEGTVYEGYTFVFTGDESQTVTVTQAAGVAEQIYNLVDVATNSDDGTLVTLVSNLTEKNDDYQDQIDRIEDRAASYKTNLTARYAKLQANISVAQSTLSYLEALLAAKSSD